MSVEIGNIPAIADEPFRPGESALTGRLLIRLKTAAPRVRSFSSRADMGSWYEELSGPRREPEATVAAKARELTAGAPDTLSKIRALASFAQKEIHYVSTQIGIGGFRPHPAASVLANRYGDCKDKATLLAALLLLFRRLERGGPGPPPHPARPLHQEELSPRRTAPRPQGLLRHGPRRRRGADRPRPGEKIAV